MTNLPEAGELKVNVRETNVPEADRLDANVPEARKTLAGGATTGSASSTHAFSESALEGREKRPNTPGITADMGFSQPSRAPAGARPWATFMTADEPVVSPPANLSRPSRTPVFGVPRRECSCLDGRGWNKGKLTAGRFVQLRAGQSLVLVHDLEVGVDDLAFVLGLRLGR